MQEIKYVNDNEFIQETLESVNVEDKKVVLRKEREKLFVAFNTYCTMKNANALPLKARTSEVEHTEILNWYSKILDLDSVAIFNVPTQVRYFM